MSEGGVLEAWPFDGAWKKQVEQYCKEHSTEVRGNIVTKQPKGGVTKDKYSDFTGFVKYSDQPVLGVARKCKESRIQGTATNEKQRSGEMHGNMSANWSIAEGPTASGGADAQRTWASQQHQTVREPRPDEVGEVIAHGIAFDAGEQYVLNTGPVENVCLEFYIGYDPSASVWTKRLHARALLGTGHFFEVKDRLLAFSDNVRFSPPHVEGETYRATAPASSTGGDEDPSPHEDPSLAAAPASSTGGDEDPSPPMEPLDQC